MNGNTTPIQQITNVNNTIGTPNLTVPEYISVEITGNYIRVFGSGKELATITNSGDNINIFLHWLEQKETENNIKFIASKIFAEKQYHPIISDLWLKNDIVPYFTSLTPDKKAEQQEEAVRTLRQCFNSDNLINISLSKLNEVEIAELVTLDDYKKISNPDEFALLLKLSEQFKGKKMIFINATPQGGGVALMRHALIRLYRLLGVDAHWHVMYPLKEAFDITKTKIHNVLQDAATNGTVLTDTDKKIYNDWILTNSMQLETVYKDADVVIIDDPQPAGLLPYIKKSNPNAKIIYRSHIQIESHLANTPGMPQYITWQFIFNNIKDADLFVSHPMKQFIPDNIPVQSTVLMPATTDALDGLNKPLTPWQTNYYLRLFDKILQENGQTALEHARPYIIQIARFDPAKGIPDVIEAYRQLIDKLMSTNILIPQLVICGHGSIDDPDGKPVYSLIMELLHSDKYKHLAADIKVARLPASDQILNALLREAKTALQLSHKEGFEIKVTEALMKGVPVIAYNAGGIPLQIVNNVSGFLVNVGDTGTVAQRLYDLITDNDLYTAMRKAAPDHINPETSTISNAINWLYLSEQLLADTKTEGNARNVKELITNKTKAAP